MVLTADQVAALFEVADHMAIPAVTRIKIHQEGIENTRDIVDFDKDNFKQVAKNLRRPGGRIP